MNLILAIDTSCDETSAAVTDGRRVLSNVISSQIMIHKNYGGVYPALAKRAHEARIDFVVQKAIDIAKKNFQISNFKFQIDAIAVTQGPGLAIALEVGIKKAKQLSVDASLPLVAINHLEGHIYSCLGENSKGLPHREIIFPALCLIVSGGHTELVLMHEHQTYEVIGATLDDACGEALDKAAKILKLGYPGGPVIEKLAEQAFQNFKIQIPRFDREARRANFKFSTPLKEKTNLSFSYSGLKTQLLYTVEKMTDQDLGKNLTSLAFSFQDACFEQIIRKTSQAIKVYQPKTLVCGGGVIANKYLRKLLRRLAKKNKTPVFFPPYKNLITDNAAMIGIAAYYKMRRKEFVKDLGKLDREPRMEL